MSELIAPEELFLKAKQILSALQEKKTAALEASLIVEHFSGLDRSLVLSSRPSIPASVCSSVGEAVERRLLGEPVYRILGFKEFYSLRLNLSPETFEPRPDTETLVDVSLSFVRSVIQRKGYSRILDLGTGTGAIGLALTSEEPHCSVLAVDISQKALETASANARSLGLLDRFSVERSNWLEQVVGEFDLIVSNPPYIKSQDIPFLQKEVRDFDPLLALDGGDDGLEAYRMIAATVSSHLSPGAVVALEMGFDQSQDVENLFRDQGFSWTECYPDLAGVSRVLVAGEFFRKDLGRRTEWM